MATISKALRSLVASEYSQVANEDRMKAAKGLAPDASRADQVRLGLVELLLPELVEAVERVIIESAEKPEARSMAGGLLTYVCNPLDIIGDDTPLGRLDDTIICAVGLRRIKRRDKIELAPRIEAICDVAEESFALLDQELRESIEEFLSQLEASTRGGQGSSAP
jgi:uncharacterized membrane protein YkvA (DUF1232 family)